MQYRRAAFLATMAFAASISRADPNVFEKSSQGQALGRALAGSYSIGAVAASDSTNQLQTQVGAQVLGANLKPLSGVIAPSQTIGGTTYAEFYSFGKRVFSQSFKLDYDPKTPNQVALGLAPTEIRVPMVVYPVGAVNLEVDGGVRFQADLDATLLPGLPIGGMPAYLDLAANATADGAGFIEGYANLYAARIGAGGQVNLIDAQGNLDAKLYLGNAKPTALINATAEFLSGQLYVFFDYLSIFGMNWKRLLTKDLYSWKGTCYEAGAMECR